MRVYRALGIALVVQASLVLAACTPEAITAFTTVATVVVQPDTLDIDVDAHAPLSAFGYNAYGLPMLGLPLTWSSANTTIAQVTHGSDVVGSGDVVGIDTGVTTIIATVGGKTGLSTVRVRRRVATVTVAPASAAVVPGQTVQLTATLHSASGQLITGRTVTWSISSTGVATVSATGLVSAIGPGVVVIAATCEGKSGSATVTVIAIPVASVTVTPASAALFVGGTTQLTATAKDATGNVLSGRTITWSSSSTTVATVSATGLITAVAAGSAAITAASEGQSGSATVTVTVIPVASVAVTPASAAIFVGGTTQLTATAKDANGNVLSGRTPTWSSSNGAFATVTATGAVTAVAVGAAIITAVVEGMSGSSSVSVAPAGADVCAPSYVVPSQPPLTGGIDVTVERLGSGCGSVLVSSGIPLAPGALTAAQASQLRLFVGGQEQSLYVEPLNGTHAGGSLRAVLVQFNYSLAAGKPVPGQLVLGQARATPDIGKPSASRTSPVAVVLPTSTTYLIGTQIVGPTLSVVATSQISTTHARYETDFVTFANQHWTQSGSNWVDNYYDRAAIYYAWWIRSGSVEYWKRATAMAVAYRTDYLEANNYNPSAHWSQIEGVELHYLLTGDESSRYAIGRVGDIFNYPYYMNNLANLPGEMDNRMQAKLLAAFLAAWRTNAPSQSGSNWATLLPQALTGIVASQDASGAYKWSAPSNQCGYNKPFMVGLLNDAMIKYHTYFNADSRIPIAIKKANDYMWTSDWNATSKAFVYLDGPCPGHDEGQLPAPDLNNLIVNGFAWTYLQTHDALYRDRADQIFGGAVAGAWLGGSKQFNQQYTSAYRYLGYRQ